MFVIAPMAKRKDWHPEDIKAAVRKTGVTLTDLARANDLSESACRQALQKATPRADQAIAKQLGVPLHKIWPSRYDERGERLKRHERDQIKRLRRSAQRLSAGAV